MKTNVLIVMALSVLIVTSCKKQEIETTPRASLQITNAVVGAGSLQFGTNVAVIANNSFNAYGVFAGNRQVKLVMQATPNAVLYGKTSDFVNGGLYSLFLAGTPSAVESVMVKEDNIITHTDNVFGIRFINLSVGSGPISINIHDANAGSLVPSLAYKALSGFNSLSAQAEEGAKVFEFRNAETGALVSSFTVPDYDIPRFRNITLVYAGNAANPVVFRVNNY